MIVFQILIIFNCSTETIHDVAAAGALQVQDPPAGKTFIQLKI